VTAVELGLRSGGWAPLARDVVRVEGPEAFVYLQGQLSQDLAGVEVGDTAWSLLLQPQGKVEAWVRVTRVAEATYVLDVDAGWGEAVAARLSRFKLRTKATIDLDPGWSFLAVRGPGDVHLAHPSEIEVLALPIWWPGMVGYDLLAPAGAPVTVDSTAYDADALDVLRVECGVPAMGAELTEATIPAEIGQWFIDASVSFTKGCYTGQELVARIDSRGGNVPKPLRGLIVADGTLVAPGAAVLADGAEVGHVTSAVRSPFRDGATIALATVARKVEVGATVAVHHAEAAHPAEVVDLPFV